MSTAPAPVAAPLASLTVSAFPTEPFVIAHRAGNHLEQIPAARAAGIQVIEADLWRFHRRIEVRHLKSVGPLPMFWDTWTVVGPFTPRLRFDQLLDALPDDTQLMLDLKGSDRRLADELRVILAARPALATRVIVCTRNWRLLAPFEDGALPVMTVRSIGTKRELRRALADMAQGHVPDGFCAHADLLTPEIVRSLRAAGSTVLSWPVNSVATARALVARGVLGLISDDSATIQGGLA